MKEVVIISAARTAIGSFGGSLTNFSATELGVFAAKEAIAKALGTGIGEIHWKDIEILQKENGEPVVNLHAKAKQKEKELGITIWALSISHSRNLAIAFVVAA